MKQKRNQQNKQEELKPKVNKNKPLMCSDYKDFGRGSLMASAVFFAISFIFGFNPVRIAVIAFFIIAGAVDLILYGKYGEG